MRQAASHGGKELPGFRSRLHSTVLRKLSDVPVCKMSKLDLITLVLNCTVLAIDAKEIKREINLRIKLFWAGNLIF